MADFERRKKSKKSNILRRVFSFASEASLIMVNDLKSWQVKLFPDQRLTDTLLIII